VFLRVVNHLQFSELSRELDEILENL